VALFWNASNVTHAARPSISTGPYSGQSDDIGRGDVAPGDEGGDPTTDEIPDEDEGPSIVDEEDEDDPAP
jgi:hypothetical protein